VSIRILLVDDHCLIREGIRSLLDRQTDMEVIAEAEHGRQAIQLARKLAPNVVIMDVAMPDMNGVEATRQITAACPTVKILALSMYPDRRFVEQMLKAGASGYLLKTCDFSELGHAIRSVNRNQVCLGVGIVDTVVEHYVRHPSEPGGARAPQLTGREREVLQLVAEGKSTKEIAALLDISVKTADAHRQRLMGKP